MVTMRSHPRSNAHAWGWLLVPMTARHCPSRWGTPSAAMPVGRHASRRMASAWSATRVRAPRSREVGNEPATALHPLRGSVRSRPSPGPAATAVAVVPALPRTTAAEWRGAGARRRTDWSCAGGGGTVSRSLWRCRNQGCRVVLGRVTAGSALVLAPEVTEFAVYLDTRRVNVKCPVCGAAREFRGVALFGNTSAS